MSKYDDSSETPASSTEIDSEDLDFDLHAGTTQFYEDPYCCVRNFCYANVI